MWCENRWSVHVSKSSRIVGGLGAMSQSIDTPFSDFIECVFDRRLNDISTCNVVLPKCVCGIEPWDDCVVVTECDIPQWIGIVTAVTHTSENTTVVDAADFMTYAKLRVLSPSQQPHEQAAVLFWHDLLNLASPGIDITVVHQGGLGPQFKRDESNKWRSLYEDLTSFPSIKWVVKNKIVYVGSPLTFPKKLVFDLGTDLTNYNIAYTKQPVDMVVVTGENDFAYQYGSGAFQRIVSSKATSNSEAEWHAATILSEFSKPYNEINEALLTRSANVNVDDLMPGMDVVLLGRACESEQNSRTSLLAVNVSLSPFKANTVQLEFGQRTFPTDVSDRPK